MKQLKIKFWRQKCPEIRPAASLPLNHTPTMSTLGDKLVQLTLDIDDKNKTLELLSKLIEEQKGRHAAESAKFEKDMEASLKNADAEKDAAMRNLFQFNEALSQKKAELESRVEELLTEKQVSGSVVASLLLIKPHPYR